MIILLLEGETDTIKASLVLVLCFLIIAVLLHCRKIAGVAYMHCASQSAVSYITWLLMLPLKFRSFHACLKDHSFK